MLSDKLSLVTGIGMCMFVCLQIVRSCVRGGSDLLHGTACACFIAGLVRRCYKHRCMCVWVCIHIYIYIYVYTYAYMTYMYVYACVYLCVPCVCVCACVCVSFFVCML